MGIRKTLCASLAGLALVTLAGCGSSSVTAQSGSSSVDTLRVAINPGFVPFEQIESGKLTGFDVDLSRALARRLGRKNTTFDQLPFTSLLPAVTSGRDQVAISGILDTATRRKQVSFSKPYINDSFVISIKSSNGSVKGISDLSKANIAVQVGTIPEEFVRAKLPKAKIVTVQDTPSAFQLVAQGRADAVITDAPVAGYYVKKLGGSLKVLPTPLNSAQPIAVVLPLHSTLQQSVDKALAAMEADGTLGKLRRTWFGSSDVNGGA
ncbi:MAG: polar amino acid transport system substrate-binding protein [Streptomycetaceae bacterium]|nr:polar amino acid transport system substrate-binding protein [Streptomycetaceae bacterium]